MSDARLIADTRLAKGEITAEEHGAIVALLTARDDEPSQPPIPPHDVSSGLSKDGAIWWMSISGGFFLAVLQAKPSESHTLDPIGWILVFVLTLAFLFGAIKAAFGK